MSHATARDGITVEGLEKSFSKGGNRVDVLRGVDLSLAAGDRVAIVGQSGSGKSTFLHILGTLDRPTAGRIAFGGRDVFERSDAALDALRNREIGFVFQFHHLLPDHDAMHNVMLPAVIGGVPMDEARARAADLLTRVGLGHRLTHRPGELSGGERQRVAIARALVAEPKCVLMDEPTGNLDHDTAETIQALFMRLNRELSISMIVVTHDLELAGKMDRIYTLRDGVLSG